MRHFSYNQNVLIRTRITFLFLFNSILIGLKPSLTLASSARFLNNDSRIEFLDKKQIKSQGQYPFAASWFLTNEKLKYSQKGERQYQFSSDCQIDKQNFHIPKDYVDFWQRCEKQLRLESSWAITHSLKTLMLKLQLMDNPWAEPVMFHLDGGQKVQGLLAMKPDSIPRPLVILRLGIFGSSTEMQAERFLFMHLFEESPFHVLILESLSGADASSHNKAPLIGGVVEGLQHLEVARALMNSGNPLSSRIQSLHLAGISLGGNGVLFAAEMQAVQNLKYFSSFIGYCPVVNLAETLAFHQGQRVSLAGMNWWASYRLKNWSNKIKFNPSEGFIDGLFENVESSYKDWIKNTNQKFLKFPDGYHKDSYWSAQQIKDYIPLVNSPFLVFATEKDPIVPFNLNAKIFENNSNITLLKLKEGYHCTLPAAYDWYTMGQLTQNFILNQSGDFGLTTKTQSFNISRETSAFSKALNKSDWFLRFARSEGFIYIEVQPKENLSQKLARKVIEFVWYKEASLIFKIPIADFFPYGINGLPTSSDKIADLDAFNRSVDESWQNEAGQNMWERWLNHNISWEINDAGLTLSWPVATNPQNKR